MKQVIQDFRTGVVSLPEVAVPRCGAGSVLVQNRASLISAGTEAAVLEFSRKSLLQKARSRPDLVKQVIAKIRADGLKATYQTVQSRLEAPLALGYSCAGEVLAVGSGVSGIQVGDRVACAGGNYATHGEIVSVPKNLVVRIPEGVSLEEAAFGTLGAIALQGLRVADVRLGERVVVLGLGLIGLLTAQLLKAAGCLVLGSDLNPERARLARELGANEAYALDSAGLRQAVEAFTQGRGADAVIITAATKSNEPVELAGEISRLKGRVVVVGDVRMDIPRKTYYEKELDLRLSMSYGPGRYDPSYEERGQDYPYAYVPFTEQRNIETFLHQIAERKVTPDRLITHRFPITDYERAYALIRGETKEPFLGVLFTYPEQTALNRTVKLAVLPKGDPPASAEIHLGVIGAGNYARLMLLPRLKTMTNVHLTGICTSRGVSGQDAGQKFGFDFATTETREILENNQINLVVIATRHDSHAAMAEAALQAGKHVFVEKPLATSEADLRRLVAAAEISDRHLMVGFNRRFAPLIQQAKAKLQEVTPPLAMLYRVNAGAIPGSHWTQDVEEGGGRIVGEVCHFVDLLQFLCGSDPVSVFATSATGATGNIPPEDIVSITIRFDNGSIGTIHYFANGDKAVPKEYLEVFGGGRVFQLDDFKQARYAAGGSVATWKSAGQDKGQSAELERLITAAQMGGSNPVPLREAVLTTLTTFRILDSLHWGIEVPIGWQEEPDPLYEPPFENVQRNSIVV